MDVQPHDGRRAEREPVPGEHVEPVRREKPDEIFDGDIADDRRRRPCRRANIVASAEVSPIFLSSSPSLAAAATMAGTLSKNVNRAATSRRSPSAIPVAMVDPDREMPGTSAPDCATPIRNAPVGVSPSSPIRCVPIRSTIQNATAPVMSATAATRGARVCASMRIREQEADDDDGNRADDDEANPARVGRGRRAERPRQRAGACCTRSDQK